MLYIIDGTGDVSPESYHYDMRRGFCWSIKEGYRHTSYHRGPELTGLLTSTIADMMYDNIVRDITHLWDRTAFFQSFPITLVGHSRGGAAVIYIANRLKDGIWIDGENILERMDVELNLNMLLFDAVDMSITISGTETIPSNVKKCLHFHRDVDFSNYFLHCEEMVALNGFHWGEFTEAGRRQETLRRYHHALRNACRFEAPDFGNVGLEGDRRHVDWRKKKGTHGALGGAPKDAYSYIPETPYAAMIDEQEVMTMLEIEREVNEFLHQIGEIGDLRLAYKPICINLSQTSADNWKKY